MVRCQPGVKNLGDLDGAAVERQPPRRLFAPVAGVTLDPNLQSAAFIGLVFHCDR
jgi:hypothetical protein